MRFISKQNLGAVRSAGRAMVAGLVAALLAANAGAEGQKTVPDVATVSMEDLMNLQVTSGAQRPQKVAEAAPAGVVISHEESRRPRAPTNSRGPMVAARAQRA